ncbi:unannotated protein [freshwater metagenome]|uniref:Unannotated protein n=1 Tax=freshwater metagenome TaxID=449393 RepID=A0A6J7KKQ1_9ZZZZ|nr:hypothetical protein [Actinomycetota bacterium]MTA55456.1 hypothetical protein [Actinomycetota bacterium]
MNSQMIASGVLLAIGLSILSTATGTAAPTVIKVYDGDTITLSTGEKVRLLQIDTPELASGECYSEEARRALISLLKLPGQITLRADPKLDQVDRYGRLLRYVFKGNSNINLKMVEIGAAAPYFYQGQKGKHSSQILKAAENAKSKSLGLWKTCPSAKLTPNNAIKTVAGNISHVSATPPAGANCDPNYAGCIPIFPADIDCTDIKRLGLAPVKVVGTDIHKLDRDGDGLGCDK